ncbi:GNAT family N-acetyltransferase [Muriicola soli]|uniref:N-acetyltransferase n=1 Tax=Muriicola soli TaxID=2507538 RepID=A0A411E885_9FLAO|nr:GNAT family N-acetyltransferase [Muriicola soli]QBA63926.1 N-acetyltransferase [Muriicola soli]
MAHPEDFPLVLTTVGNQKRFELQLPQGVAYVEYIQNVQGIIYLTHTEVPKQLEGKGVGSALLKKVFAHIRSLEVKLAPLCPFVASYLNRYPEEGKGMLAPGFFIGN